MKFEEVLPALREGKKIRRKIWGRERSFIVIKDDSLVDNLGRDVAIYTYGLKAIDWEIVEEKKKVKLRDLTPEQFEKYCKNFTGKYTYGTNCDKCVFHNVSCNSWYDSCWIKHKDLYSDKFLDQEVEIED